MLYYAMQQQRLPVVIVDSKNERAFDKLPNSLVCDGLTTDWIASYTSDSPVSTVVIRPYPEECTPDALDDFLYSIYETATNVCVCIDELYMVHKNGRAGRGLIALLTRGRSDNITVIGATQRPTWLSMFCLSEADYYMIYRLKLAKDRERMAELTGDTKTLEQLDKYHYWCYGETQDFLSSMPPVSQPLAATSVTPADSQDTGGLFTEHVRMM